MHAIGKRGCYFLFSVVSGRLLMVEDQARRQGGFASLEYPFWPRKDFIHRLAIHAY